ncbi:MAG: hypothetical protein M1829_004085 [Trizodia sp. TS-e1964]|nr:MAG: hypothetical protein M1829_004085 [Trizodia sp. TS-e1964]
MASRDLTELYERVESYAWDQDEEFQGGLAAILGPSPSPQQAQELALTARCFYYSKKFNVSLDVRNYKVWRQPNLHAHRNEKPHSGSSEGQESGETGSAPYPATFAQIVDLITANKPIPGIKHIPNTILEGKESVSRAAPRKKPWEVRIFEHVVSGDGPNHGKSLPSHNEESG